jgi:hypothetical protein
MQRPLSTDRARPQFLHVRVTGPVQSIDAGSSQLRLELLEKERQREYLRLHIFLQREELKFELIANLNSPGRRHNI